MSERTTAESKIYRAALLIIGNEILSGRTQDKNLAFLGKRLNELGVRLSEVRVLPDLLEELAPAMRELSAKYDYVFTTGGIGPTHDDITVDCVAAAFEVPVVVHPEARKILEDYYGDRINEARMRMARVPEGGGLIDNPVSKAPGICFKNFFIMAGVPSIMQAQFESTVHEISGGAPLLSMHATVHVGESMVAAELTALQGDYPDVDMGSYPFAKGGTIGTTLVFRSTDRARLEEAANKIVAQLAERGIETEAVEGDGARNTID